MEKQKEKSKTQKKENVIFSWKTPEYIVHDKSKQWYITAATAVIITALIGLLTDNLTLSIVVVLLAAVYYYTHRLNPPKDIEVKITAMGIRVGRMYFPYSHIETFWIIYKDDLKTLNLRVMKRYHTDVNIQLNDQDPVLIREYLVGQVPEWEGKDENTSDILFRKLKL